MEKYPRYLTPDLQPFNPLEVAKKTEEIVCRNNRRKYTAFYTVGVYRGIATGYTVGCCLRCFYCWVGLGRDFPEKYGEFFSPPDVVKKLEETARKHGVRKCRISGGEPTLCKNHILSVLRLIESNSWFELFILETNGILLGADKNYVEALIPFTKVHVRVSLKAGNEKGFQQRTGAIGKFYELPFKAVENMFDAGISFHVAAMTDPRIMPKEERKALIQRLAQINKRIALNLEEEIIDPYETTLFRLKKAGIKLTWC